MKWDDYSFRQVTLQLLMLYSVKFLKQGSFENLKVWMYWKCQLQGINYPHSELLISIRLTEFPCLKAFTKLAHTCIRTGHFDIETVRKLLFWLHTETTGAWNIDLSAKHQKFCWKFLLLIHVYKEALEYICRSSIFMPHLFNLGGLISMTVDYFL